MQRIEIEIGLRSLSLRLSNEPDPKTLPPLRILCLDGGGMKGLVLVKMLMKIEEKCGVQVMEISKKILKKKFSHLFDLVCGTSTGGLIALSQLKTPRKGLDEMLELYLGLGRDVFRYHIGGKSPIMGTVHKLSGYFQF
jgi:calcium-independent phospholipase A2-gamma